MLDKHLKNTALKIQKTELTEHIIYRKLAPLVKIKKHAEVLEKLSKEELEHYNFFKDITKQDIGSDKLKIFTFVSISRIFGLSFGLKLMESGEGRAQKTYAKLKDAYPKIQALIDDEEKHEDELLGLIDEDRLKYISSVVLGLNDALVELTASLAGFTLALQNTRLIGIVGLITGIAAATSMAASEYLSTKYQKTDKNPLKASLYTGVAYILTVAILVFPFFLFRHAIFCLGLAVANALLIIAAYNFYISVAKSLDFKKRFTEMAGLSLSVATATFFIGLLIRKVFHIDV